MAIKTFTTGEVLTASDTNTYLANSGLVYITEVALSTTALDGIFTSTYDNYRIVINQMKLNTAGGILRFNWRDTSNATVNASNYYTATQRWDSASTAYNYGQQATAFADSGINLTTTGEWASCSIEIYGPRLSTQTSSLTTGIGAINGPSVVSSAHGYNAVQAHAGIVFSVSSGTFATGRVFVYGYRKA
jgi:hypothetical protein